MSTSVGAAPRRQCSWPPGRTSCARSLPLHIHVLPPGHTDASRLSMRCGRSFGKKKRRGSAFGSLCPLEVASGRSTAVASHAWHGHPARTRTLDVIEAEDPEACEGRRTPGIRDKRHRNVSRPLVRTWMCARAVRRIPGVRRPRPEPMPSRCRCSCGCLRRRCRASCRKGACSRYPSRRCAAIRAQVSTAACRLDGSAIPLPARSSAVPWSTATRG